MRLLRRAAASLLPRQVILSALFVVLIAIAMAAQAHVPYAVLKTSERERVGIARIADTQELLTAVTGRQIEPGRDDRTAIGDGVARVLNPPANERVDVSPTFLDAVRRRWDAVRQRPHDEAALAALGAATAELVSKISDAAQLTYDSDVDVDNFADAATYQLPKSLENAARAVALADRAPSSLTVKDRIGIGRLMAQAGVGWSGADNDFSLGVAATDVDPKLLSAQRDLAADAFDALQKRLDAIADGPSADSRAALLGEYRTYESAAKGLLGGLDSSVDTLMKRRVDRQRDRIMFTVVLGTIAIALALALIARISRGMLERERRELQIEKDRATSLETELARRRAERERVLGEAQFRAIFDGSPLGIATLDRHGTLLERNAALLEMLDDLVLFDDTFDAATFSRLLAGELPPQQFEREVRVAAGDSRWLDVTVSPIRIADGDSVAAIAMIADVTDRKSLSEQLRYEAKHDALTGLRSRGAFLEDLGAALAHVPANGDESRAVMLLDLDRFKIVNDTLGHAAGDDVLVTIAKRLREIVRPTDVLARLHGDEFAVLLTAKGESELSAIAARAQHVVRAPIVIDGQSICVDSSIGICVAQSGTSRPEDIVRNADTAMFNAKRMGRGRSVYFSGSMQEASTKFMRLASEMLIGLERGEFRVAYQPIVSLDDATIQGFEALLRWNHHDLGEISPVEFIPIAEETGAIVQLGRFVLAEACRQVSRWDWEHRRSQPVTMSINLSARQLEEYIVGDLERSIAEAGISGDRLILEITESTLLESGAQITNILERLRATGARMCLDDFGTGYSSLRYLQQFPIDQLKIDRSFVCGPNGALASEPIVRMLLNLAETLGLRVIAEGIESEIQNDHLIALGCRLGQGFRFSPARPPGDISLAGPLGPAIVRRSPIARIVS